jgi:hypothetical protein
MHRAAFATKDESVRYKEVKEEAPDANGKDYDFKARFHHLWKDASHDLDEEQPPISPSGKQRRASQKSRSSSKSQGPASSKNERRARMLTFLFAFAGYFLGFAAMITYSFFVEVRPG